MGTSNEERAIECPKCGRDNCWAHGMIDMPEGEIDEKYFMSREITDKQLADNESSFYKEAA